MSLYGIFMGLNSILMAYIRLLAAHHDTKNCDKDCKEIQDLVPREIPGLREQRFDLRCDCNLFLFVHLRNFFKAFIKWNAFLQDHIRQLVSCQLIELRYKILGMENLEKIRHHRGLSKRQFSLYLGLSEGHYNKVLNGYGNFSIKTWWKIADALIMDLRKLIGRHEDDV